jgi:ribosomal protein L22
VDEEHLTASINSRRGTPFFDFRWQDKRRREHTDLQDTPTNRKRANAVLKLLEKAIADGTFALFHSMLFVWRVFGAGRRKTPQTRRSSTQSRRHTGTRAILAMAALDHSAA